MRLITNKEQKHGLWGSINKHQCGLPFAFERHDNIEIGPESTNAGSYSVYSFLIGPIQIAYVRPKRAAVRQ